MKKIIRKTIALLSGLFILSSSFLVLAFDLNYSGGSTSNNTGAGNTTSGYQISVIDPTYGNNVKLKPVKTESDFQFFERFDIIRRIC